MKWFEELSVFVSLIAVWIACLALIRNRKVSEKVLQLESKQAELAEKQLQMINRSEREASVAKLDVEIKGTGQERSFNITNIGGAPATNVTFDIDIDTGVSPT